MEQLNIKHECKRYGCAVLAATVFAINIKTFVRAGGLYPGGVSGLTLLIQNIFAQFLGLQIPYTVISMQHAGKKEQTRCGQRLWKKRKQKQQNDFFAIAS